MHRGIIVQVEENFSVILSDGEFYRIHNKGPMSQGMTMLFTKEDLYAEKKVVVKSIYSGLKLRYGLVLMVVFMVMAGLFYDAHYSVYGVVTMDINPSVALHLNKDSEVLRVEAMNVDGEIFNTILMKGLKLDEALEELINKAASMGYISEDEVTYVVLTKIPTRRSMVSRMEGLTVKSLLSEADVPKAMTVVVTEGTEEALDQARETHRPMGVVVLEENYGVQGTDSVKEFFMDETLVETLVKDGILDQVLLNKGADHSREVQGIVDALEVLSVDEPEIKNYLLRAKNALELGKIEDVSLKKEGKALLEIYLGDQGNTDVVQTLSTINNTEISQGKGPSLIIINQESDLLESLANLKEKEGTDPSVKPLIEAIEQAIAEGNSEAFKGLLKQSSDIINREKNNANSGRKPTTSVNQGQLNKENVTKEDNGKKPEKTENPNKKTETVTQKVETTKNPQVEPVTTETTVITETEMTTETPERTEKTKKEKKAKPIKEEKDS